MVKVSWPGDTIIAARDSPVFAFHSVFPTTELQPGNSGRGPSPEAVQRCTTNIMVRNTCNCSCYSNTCSGWNTGATFLLRGSTVFQVICSYALRTYKNLDAITLQESGPWMRHRCMGCTIRDSLGVIHLDGGPMGAPVRCTLLCYVHLFVRVVSAFPPFCVVRITKLHPHPTQCQPLHLWDFHVAESVILLHPHQHQQPQPHLLCLPVSDAVHHQSFCLLLPPFGHCNWDVDGHNHRNCHP